MITAVVRRGLRLVLDAEPALRVVAEASDRDAAVQCGLDPEVDLAILDISMPRKTGQQAVAELSRRRPMLGMRDRVQLTRYAIRHGLIEP